LERAEFELAKAKEKMLPVAEFTEGLSIIGVLPKALDFQRR
jgi:hypothetical protein